MANIRRTVSVAYSMLRVFSPRLPRLHSSVYFSLCIQVVIMSPREIYDLCDPLIASTALSCTFLLSFLTSIVCQSLDLLYQCIINSILILLLLLNDTFSPLIRLTFPLVKSSSFLSEVKILNFAYLLCLLVFCLCLSLPSLLYFVSVFWFSAYASCYFLLCMHLYILVQSLYLKLPSLLVFRCLLFIFYNKMEF